LIFVMVFILFLQAFLISAANMFEQ
jgi:hypothetical protein